MSQMPTISLLESGRFPNEVNGAYERLYLVILGDQTSQVTINITTRAM